MNNSLDNIITNTIRESGPVTFKRFMDMALYYPGLGYYTSADTGIGRKGDFYTSPHLHPTFGMVLARQVEECWDCMGRPGDFMVIEQGAGKGYLALDILDYLRDRDIYTTLQYTIVEINPDASADQKKMLGGHVEKIRWIKEIKDIEMFTGCLVSNELLDSFPVHLIQMDDCIREVYVDLDGDDFVEVTGEPATPDIERYVEEFSVAHQKGYRTEINLKIKEWLEGISSRISDGFIITIDYGYNAETYYSEERDRGTLMCYFRHQVNEDPYRNIGKQDITAHVNFSSVKKWGEESGLETLGYAGQGIYMVSMGLDEIISEKYLNNDNYQFEMAKIKGLIVPGGLGESHKVMIQYKGDSDVRLRGFNIRNRMGVL
ncbi:hypothetical protein BMS3Abin07_02225 [bacterium BMS3Abin07]|nr:hypothetical protein BMS3Abin07_02225 [bacterium BMS3Abin07]GBE32940.1 hypothetical protein BMS3Bbin05_01871 [bacterium BMS3Bbin05]HDL20045.1 SAM-dependent methyltransferase [Nitrospirota bacterium]HDO23069.1 SAM-dependent methyltransferase [Nitrospirota bacterium]HDZ87752.1 SAM-dependent methyltransferase [Nitrospirota bacterium]